MDWVEQLPVHGPTPFLSRPASQPVFVDPHGHRVRRLRHGARVIAGAAGVYLALLALGLAGPATSPFSLLPGVNGKAGESGTEAVRSGAGGAVSADRVRDTGAGGSVVQGQPLPVAGLPAAGGTAPAAAAPVAPPAAAVPAPAAPSRSAPPAASAPAAKSSPKPAPAQGAGPPAGHVAPGQAKKVPGGNGNANGNGTGTGSGPPANHGQQMAAEHSRSPNH